MSEGVAAGFAIVSPALTLPITGSGAAQKWNGCSGEPWMERT
jgi:hypothetical protein